jgi:hypothetical protein
MISKFVLNLLIAVSSAIIGMVVLAFLGKLETLNRFHYLILNLIIPGFAIVFVYILLAKMLKIKEMDDF